MGALVWLVIVVCRWSYRLLPVFTRFCFRCFCGGIAVFFTPKGQVRYGSFQDTEAYRELDAEGYNVEARFAPDAMASIKREA
jgi:hypothetical protein